jgi:hypothetical protein
MYALEVFSNVSESETNTIFQVFETVGVAAFLQTHPFQRLSLRQDLKFQNQTVLGLYGYQTGEAEISVSRAINTGTSETTFTPAFVVYVYSILVSRVEKSKPVGVSGTQKYTV